MVERPGIIEVRVGVGDEDRSGPSRLTGLGASSGSQPAGKGTIRRSTPHRRESHSLPGAPSSDLPPNTLILFSYLEKTTAAFNVASP